MGALAPPPVPAAAAGPPGSRRADEELGGDPAARSSSSPRPPAVCRHQSTRGAPLRITVRLKTGSVRFGHPIDGHFASVLIIYYSVICLVCVYNVKKGFWFILCVNNKCDNYL